MKLKYKAFFIALTAAATTLTGCDSFLEDYSQDLAKVESWNDLDEVLIGDAYMKSGRQYTQNSGVYDERDCNFDFLHLMTDEMELTDDDGAEPLKIRTNYYQYIAWQPDLGIDYNGRFNGDDEDTWNDLYKRINICNMVLALIDEQPENSPADKTGKLRVKGEAQFLRAFYYLTLANLYCEPYVPSKAETMMGMPIKTTEFVEDVEFSRENLADTYKFIVNELEEAEKNLEGIERKTPYRGSLTAVNLLQSRVYLYMQDWANAAEYAKKVLSRQDALLDLRTKSLGDNCVSFDSPETIMSMGDYFIAYAFQDSRSYIPGCKVSDYMCDLYRNNDLRKGLYIGNSEYRKEPATFLKYDGQRRTIGTYQNYGSVFSLRTPEAYLTLAEASAFNNDENTARQTLEKFLAYRMSGPISVTESGNALIDFIREERAREFLLEGHRWFDLRRYTVCEPYPWSKEIVHPYAIYDGYYFDHFDYYKLEPYDAAYTLAVPRNILSFQVSLGTHKRPARAAMQSAD